LGIGLPGFAWSEKSNTPNAAKSKIFVSVHMVFNLVETN
jgi:hypothetical protein